MISFPMNTTDIGIITSRGGEEGESGLITMATGSSTHGDSGSILIQTGHAFGKLSQSFDPSRSHAKGKRHIFCSFFTILTT